MPPPPSEWSMLRSKTELISSIPPIVTAKARARNTLGAPLVRVAIKSFSRRNSEWRSTRGRKALHLPTFARAVDASLRRLKTDRIDLYQLHQPDPATPIAETLGALHELVRAGKVCEIGCSNFSVAQLREAASVKNVIHFVSVQNEFSLFHREPEKDGVLAECELERIAFLPYFPLANGLLTGKYRAGETPPGGSRAADGFGPKVFTKRNLEIVESPVRIRSRSRITPFSSWRSRGCFLIARSLPLSPARADLSKSAPTLPPRIGN